MGGRPRRAGKYPGFHVRPPSCVNRGVGKLCLTCALAAGTLGAGEYAMLGSGALLYADRHQIEGDRVRLYRGDGFIELPCSVIVRIEPAEVERRPSAEPPAEPKAAADPRELIANAAARYGGRDFLALIESVAEAESGYRTDAVSPKGARGLMQLMPETARLLQADPDDPAQNAEAGARFLRDLLLKYRDHPHQVRLALAAYNAGPETVKRYGGIPPYRETIRYIERVLSALNARLRSSGGGFGDR